MSRYLAAVLIALNLLAPNLYAEGAATPIRASIARVDFEFRPSSAVGTTRPLQGPSAPRRHRNGVIVAALATAGMFAGMFVASKVALPCHCDDPESVVARGAIAGAAAGAAAGVVITLR